jgi:hypothetical protein
MEVKEMHDSNIAYILILLNVLKFLKFMDVKEEQPLNIRAVSVTIDELKLEKSISIILVKF